MKTTLSIVFSLVAGAAQAHPALLPHQHPHDWSVLPGADVAAVAAIAIGLGAVVLAYRRSRTARIPAKRSRHAPK